MRLFIEKCLVVEIFSVDPGVAPANHLSIDVAVAYPDVTHRAAVAIRVSYADLDLFSKHLV